MNDRRKEDIELGDIRKDISEIVTNLAILTNQVSANHKSLRDSLDRIVSTGDKHEKTLYGNGAVGLTSKVNEALNIKKSLDDHSIVDKWMFGILITMEIGILVKLFLN